jgi:NTP pyrophosphatase (non-canonical NTP hydrolase)
MNAATYYNNALRTANLFNSDLDRMHAFLGMMSEVGELADILKRKIAYGKPIDAVHFLEEAGDALWYVPLLLKSCDGDEVLFSAIVEECLKHAPDVVNAANDERREVEESDFVLVTGAVVSLSDILSQKENIVDGLGMFILSLSAMLVSQGLTLEDAMEKNIAKLQARYPDKFTVEAALHRDLERERSALEGSNEAA